MVVWRPTNMNNNRSWHTPISSSFPFQTFLIFNVRCLIPPSLAPVWGASIGIYGPAWRFPDVGGYPQSSIFSWRSFHYQPSKIHISSYFIIFHRIFHEKSTYINHPAMGVALFYESTRMRRGCPVCHLQLKFRRHSENSVEGKRGKAPKQKMRKKK